MEKSEHLKPIIFLLKFYINSSLKGLLNRPFFQSVRNRYLFIGFMVILYFAYFYLNMIELAKLQSHHVDLVAVRITLFSFFDNSIILGSLINLFVNNTVAMDKVSLFFTKTLPFSQKSIDFSWLLFKNTVGLILFEFLMLIISFGISLITQKFVLFVLILLATHFIFLVSFNFTDWCRLFFANHVFRQKNQLLILFDLSVLTMMLVYFFNLRFNLEMYLGKQEINVSGSSSIVLFLSMLLLIGILVLRFWSKMNEGILAKTKYIKNIVHPNLLLGFFLMILTRTKNFVFIASLVLFTVLVFSINQGFHHFLTILQMMMPVIAITFVYYYDTISEIRMMLGLWRISYQKEFIYVNYLFLIFGGILAFLKLLNGNIGELNELFYVLSLTTILLIVGFIFPKSNATINEMLSVILFLFAIGVLSFLKTVDNSQGVTFVIVESALLFMLKKERELS